VDDSARVETNISRAAVIAKSMNNRPQDHPPDLPNWVKPQLCKLVDAPPRGPEWLNEIKYDE
jgi:ATP-dependent DNA ligase